MTRYVEDYLQNASLSLLRRLLYWKGRDIVILVQNTTQWARAANSAGTQYYSLWISFSIYKVNLFSHQELLLFVIISFILVI